jgi:hypothetical protein
MHAFKRSHKKLYLNTLWIIVLKISYGLLLTNCFKNPSWALLSDVFRLCLFYLIIWYPVPTLAVTQIHEFKKADYLGFNKRLISNCEQLILIKFLMFQ